MMKIKNEELCNL